MSNFKKKGCKKIIALRYSVFLLLVSISANLGRAQTNQLPYKNPKLSIEDRVMDLLARMNMTEKIMQLNQYLLGENNNPNNMGGKIERIPAEIGSLLYTGQDPVFRNAVQRKAMEESRLGIPIIFAYDVIHGFRTIYPIGLAQACSWNPTLVEQLSGVAANESKLSGIDWTFSPMVDVAHDARWGRVAEGYGEDPYVNACFAKAAIRGYQETKGFNSYAIAACLKHFVGYGASEAGRDYVYTEISNQTLWDTYLPSFKAGIDQGALTVMSAFNDINGIPASANQYTLTEILRNKWKFEGFVVSDWGAVKQLQNQGIANSDEHAVALAINAGVDIDMTDKLYSSYLEELVSNGTVDINVINQAVKRVLTVKFKLGMFENPYVAEIQESERYLLPNYQELAFQLAAESMVLLKNEHQLLPLKRNKKIALIGPLADDRENLLGAWNGHGQEEEVDATLYDAFKNYFQKVYYTKGCDFEGSDTSGFEVAKNTAKKVDVIVLCLGEKAIWSGENASRTSIELPDIQKHLIQELRKLNKPIVLLLSNGRPLALQMETSTCDAILEIWQPGTSGGNAVVKLLSGELNPSGKLAMSFPRTTGQLPLYYNMRSSARPKFRQYQDIPDGPLYPFGYGLSYSNFDYDNLKAEKITFTKDDLIELQISVTNSSSMDGYETVHWFVRDPVASISRPVKELKFFEKKWIKAGTTEIFSFIIHPEKDLSFLNPVGNRILEPGIFEIQVNDEKLAIELIDESK